MEMKKKYIISENFETKVYLTESFWENALLVAGFVPVIGEVADIILIIKYLKERRFIEAGLMLFALIPTFGDFVVKPFIKFGKSAGALSSVGKFGNFLKTNKTAAQMYTKVGKGFNNPIIEKLIKQIEKILPKSGKDMEAAKNLHINMWGKVVEKEGEKTIGNWAKQTTRQAALKKYLIKTGGVPPKNFLSGWWNVVYKARRNRKNFIHKTILGSNLLASLGIFSIQDLENRMSDEKESEKLLQDPKFKQWYDQVNKSQPTDVGQQTNQPSSEPKSSNDFLSSILGNSGGVLGLQTLKTIASFIA